MKHNLYGQISKMPVLSIIVPVYNLERYLNRCIESILGQTFENFQLILIDDGSIDSSGTICDYYGTKDSRVQVLHQVNLGVSATRNKGIECSNGSYISFIDGDDWIDKDFYDTLMKKLLYHQDIDIIVSGYKKDFSDGVSVQNFKQSNARMLTKTQAVNMMLKRQYFSWELCDKIYKKTLFNNCLFNNKLLNGEDFSINCRLFTKAKKIYYYPLNAYHYYMRANSMTHVLYDGKKTFLDAIDDVLSHNIFENNERIKRYLLHRYFKCCALNIFQMFFWDELYYKKLILWHMKRLYFYINIARETDSFNKDELFLIGIFAKDYVACKNYFVKNYNSFCDYLKKLINIYDNVYIYGAGIVGQHIYAVFFREKIKCAGFVISDGQSKTPLVKDNFFYLSQIDTQKSNFFILGVDNKNKKILKSTLIRNGYKNYYWPQFCGLF
ncbi:glycosyltransferase family 2 protein [Pectinatus frisingensis]|uniref:glycosyltransferase family 2 protein n=1 Tax=Pectinatus frisingensis TaxID=865 RepID=UPI0018C6B08D|nr:glycosyltransferase [Pectinatus frisingensis]